MWTIYIYGDGKQYIFKFCSMTFFKQKFQNILDIYMYNSSYLISQR